VLHVHSGLGRNKVRRDMMRARNRKGFGWTRWSRRLLYITLRLFNRYRVYQVTVTGLPAGAESCPGMIGPMSIEAKQTGERNARRWHVAFDAAEAGNVAWSRWCDTRGRKSEATGNTNFDLNRRASLRPYL
jgi:hypothetical protein